MDAIEGGVFMKNLRKVLAILAVAMMARTIQNDHAQAKTPNVNFK